MKRTTRTPAKPAGLKGRGLPMWDSTPAVAGDKAFLARLIDIADDDRMIPTHRGIAAALGLTLPAVSVRLKRLSGGTVDGEAYVGRPGEDMKGIVRPERTRLVVPVAVVDGETALLWNRDPELPFRRGEITGFHVQVPALYMGTDLPEDLRGKTLTKQEYAKATTAKTWTNVRLAEVDPEAAATRRAARAGSRIGGTVLRRTPSAPGTVARKADDELFSPTPLARNCPGPVHAQPHVRNTDQKTGVAVHETPIMNNLHRHDQAERGSGSDVVASSCSPVNHGSARPLAPVAGSRLLAALARADEGISSSTPWQDGAAAVALDPGTDEERLKTRRTGGMPAAVAPSGAEDVAYRTAVPITNEALHAAGFRTSREPRAVQRGNLLNDGRDCLREEEEGTNALPRRASVHLAAGVPVPAVMGALMVVLRARFLATPPGDPVPPPVTDAELSAAVAEQVLNPTVPHRALVGASIALRKVGIVLDVDPAPVPVPDLHDEAEVEDDPFAPGKDAPVPAPAAWVRPAEWDLDPFGPVPAASGPARTPAGAAPLPQAPAGSGHPLAGRTEADVMGEWEASLKAARAANAKANPYR